MHAYVKVTVIPRRNPDLVVISPLIRDPRKLPARSPCCSRIIRAPTNYHIGLQYVVTCLCRHFKFIFAFAIFLLNKSFTYMIMKNRQIFVTWFFLFYFIQINIAYQKLVKTLSFASLGTEFVKVIQMELETTLTYRLLPSFNLWDPCPSFWCPNALCNVIVYPALFPDGAHSPSFHK